MANVYNISSVKKLSQLADITERVVLGRRYAIDQRKQSGTEKSAVQTYLKIVQTHVNKSELSAQALETLKKLKEQQERYSDE